MKTLDILLLVSAALDAILCAWFIYVMATETWHLAKWYDKLKASAVVAALAGKALVAAIAALT